MAERMTAQERAAKLQLGKRTTADAAAAIEAAEAARDARWRVRAKKLVRCARAAQEELIIKTLRHSALMAVLTDVEVADLNARIKARHQKVREVIASRRALAAQDKEPDHGG